MGNIKDAIIFTEGVQQVDNAWEQDMQELVQEKEAVIAEYEKEHLLMLSLLERLVQPRYAAQKVQTFKDIELFVKNRFGKCTGPLRKEGK